VIEPRQYNKRIRPTLCQADNLSHKPRSLMYPPLPSTPTIDIDTERSLESFGVNGGVGLGREKKESQFVSLLVSLVPTSDRLSAGVSAEIDPEKRNTGATQAQHPCNTRATQTQHPQNNGMET
jgi:hypothetical protein